MDRYQFASDPIANPESIVKGSQYRFTVLDNRVLRYEWAEDGVFEDRASTFAIFRNFTKPDFRVEDKDDQLEIIADTFHLTYYKSEFSPNSLAVSCSGRTTDWGAEWRYGQPPENNLGGTARTLDGVDGRCDMGTGILSRAGYSTLDDSESMLFDGKGFVTPRRPGKRIDGYLFSYGFDYKGAMESFYAISGHQPTVPRWCLGNWWSRYHAYDEDEYLSLMDQFEENEIPLSVAVIDMDWHWVKEDFVDHTGWTGYSWNTKLFPDPKRFNRALHDRGLKITLNDHPHSGIHHHEEVYEELAKALGHDTRHQAPIQFDPTSQKFMYAFFNIVHRKLEDKGCDFWWIDWQQGTNSRIPGFDPLWLLNHFQYLDTKQSNAGSLPLIFSRYAGPGSHRYPVGFSGDSFATWASLKFQPEFTATASNIGFGWWSHDIGGHLPGDRDDECTTRWVFLAVFSPLLRLHSTVNRWMSKEPWLYRPDALEAIRFAMQFRHRLIPYIYSIAAAPNPSEPLVQPLYWHFPKHDEAYRFPNQYYFGSSLVVSPVVVPRDPRTNLAKTTVWIPPGRHVDFFTGVTYDGHRELDMYRSLDSIPVLAPEGSVIPLDYKAVPANGCGNPGGIGIDVVVGRDGRFEILEDVRDNPGHISSDIAQSRRCIKVTWDQAAGRLTIDDPREKEWVVNFIATQIQTSDVEVRREKMLYDEESGRFDGRVVTLVSASVSNSPALSKTTRISLLDIPRDTERITIDVGPNPQLDVLDHTSAIDDMLRGFQIEFNTKDQIWGIVTAHQPLSVKVGRLMSLGLDEAIIGPVLELMLADSRTGTVGKSDS